MGINSFPAIVGPTGATGAVGAAGPVLPQVFISDTKANTTNGGTFTTGAWRTRVLQTVDDHSTGVTVVSNQIIVPAGTWEILASVPAIGVSSHVAQLYNITDSAAILIGTAEFTFLSVSNFATTRSIIQGQFVLAAQKTLEIQHNCSVTNANIGFGTPASLGVNEIYTLVKLIKVA